MKSILTSLVVCCFAFIATAQITITQNEMPTSGDTLRYSQTTPNQAILDLYVQTGANFTWDFSFLESESQGLDEYENALQTSYAFFFLGFNNYGRKIADELGAGAFTFTNIYDFYGSSSTEFKAIGRGLTYNSIPLPAYFGDDDEIYQFPLEYGDRDSSTFDFAVSVPGTFDYKTVGYRINDVDGWGEITTPYGTFECIRLVSDIVAVDSITAFGFSIGFPNVRKEYRWLAANEKFPILEITGNDVQGAFTPNQVRYRDNYALASGTHDLEEQYALSVSPNPATDYLIVKYTLASLGNVNMQLLDVSGKIVQKWNYNSQGGEQQQELKVNGLPAGMYWLWIRIGEEQQAVPVFIK